MDVGGLKYYFFWVWEIRVGGLFGFCWEVVEWILLKFRPFLICGR